MPIKEWEPGFFYPNGVEIFDKVTELVREVNRLTKLVEAKSPSTPEGEAGDE